MSVKKIYGLIGYPLTHSYSQQYFSNKFRQEKIVNAEYQLFPLEKISHFQKLLDKNPNLQGLNVTIPFKEKIIPFLHKTDETAAQVGAVNTVGFRNKELIGYNTDIFGFKESLQPLLRPFHRKALILGTGGAAKAASFVLSQLKIPYNFISRNPLEGEIAYDKIEQQIIAEHQIIINATPVGMAPAADNFPAIPYKYITEQHLLFDMIYNPEETLFMQKGKAAGATVKNGLEMLHLQAEKSWEIWNS